MDRAPVDSSNVASVGYDPASETLEIEFKTGSIYQYYDVPQFMHEQLMQAPSVGVFFNTNIKNVYADAKV